MKKLFILIIAAFSTIFFSCEKDLYEDSIKNNSRKLKIKKVSLSDIDNNTSFKIVEKVKQFKSQGKQNKSNQNSQDGKFAYNDVLDLYIDFENGSLIESGDSLFYTFPMFRKSEENLENILFVPKENDQVDLYFVKYDVKPEDLGNLTEIEKSNLSIQVYRQTGQLICFDVINRFLVYPNGCQETHSNGYTCTPEVVTEITTFCDWVSPGGGGSNSSGGNVGGGNIGGGGITGNPIITEPIPQIITSIIGLTPTQINFKDFIKGLSDEQQEWWQNPLNENTRKEIEEYVNQNPNNFSVFIFSEQLIDFAIENNNSLETIQEISSILDILDDGKINGEDILVAPDVSITDMADYLSCFDTSQPATITLYADQPISGSKLIISPTLSVGHAFVSIKQGTKIKSFGFYPISTLGSALPNPATADPRDFLSTPGVFGNDENHTYDVSITTSITATQLSNIITNTITVAQSNPQYNLGSMNCTDLAILIFNISNLEIPSCESPGVWSGQTPGTLGEVIRDLVLPAGSTKNTTGGTAPANSNN